MNIFDILEMKKGDRPDYGKRKSGAKAMKSKVKTYPTIKDALSDGYYGQIFSTEGAGRLYVISKGKWGSKSGRGKIAKGFTKGSATPSAEFPSIKKFASRTMVRHGKRAKATLGKKYMPKGQQDK